MITFNIENPAHVFLVALTLFIFGILIAWGTSGFSKDASDSIWPACLFIVPMLLFVIAMVGAVVVMVLDRL